MVFARIFLAAQSLGSTTHVAGLVIAVSRIQGKAVGGY